MRRGELLRQKNREQQGYTESVLGRAKDSAKTEEHQVVRLVRMSDNGRERLARES